MHAQVTGLLAGGGTLAAESPQATTNCRRKMLLLAGQNWRPDAACRPVAMVKSRSHLPELAAFNAMAVTLVVLGHSVPGPAQDQGGRALVWLIHLIYRFHMPLFWWSAGYLFCHTNPPERQVSWRRFLSAKAARLLIPYVVISSTAFPIKAAMASHAIRPVSLTLGSYWESLVYPWLNPIIYFWFLPTLFLIFAVAPGLRWALLRRGPAVCWLVSAGLLGLNLTQETAFGDLLNYRGFLRDMWVFWLGMLACKFRPGLGWLESPISAVLSAIALVGLAVGEVPTSGLFVNWAGTVGALAGIIVCWFVAQRLAAKAWAPVAEVHRWSFTIYLLSWFPQIFFKLLVGQLLGLWWLAAGLMLVGGLGIPIGVALAMRRCIPSLLPVIGADIHRKQTDGHAASTVR